MTTQLPPVAGDDPAKPASTVRRLRIALAVAIVVALLAVAGVILLAVRGGDNGAAPSPTPTPTQTATTPPASPTTPTTTPTPTIPIEVDTATVVWPTAASGVRYDDPVDAALGFATRFVGMSRPRSGGFDQGDSRSGEVVVTRSGSGPDTVVLVRQLEDGNWWVLGSVAAGIRLDRPSAGNRIGSPVRLAGAAHTFEGHVDVAVVEDGDASPLGTAFVTGAGNRMGPFDGEVALTRAPTQQYGALMLTEPSAEDGEPTQATVIRIRL